jgi:hypothetical protein
MIYKIFTVVVAAVGVVLLLSLPLAFVVMLLWNWVMVDVFALTALTFGQAWGLYMLCGLLFKSTSFNSNS